MTVPQRCTGLQICIRCAVLRHFHRSLSDNSCQNKPRKSFGGRGVGTQKPTVLYNHKVHPRVQLLCRPVSGTTELSMMWTQSFPNIKRSPWANTALWTSQWKLVCSASAWDCGKYRLCYYEQPQRGCQQSCSEYVLLFPFFILLELSNIQWNSAFQLENTLNVM